MPWRNFRVALAGYPGGETRFRGALMLDVERSLQVIKRGSDELLIEAELIERLKNGRPLRTKTVSLAVDILVVLQVGKREFARVMVR